MTSKFIPARIAFSDEMNSVLNKLSYQSGHSASRLALHLIYRRDGEYVTRENGMREWQPGTWITHTTHGNNVEVIPVYDDSGNCVDAHLTYIRPDVSKVTGKQIKVTGKIGRTLKKFILPECSDMFSDSEWESLVNVLKKVAMRDAAGTFAIVRGEDIRAAYDEDNYADEYETGSLGESCMRYSYCYDYLQLYASNPRQVSLLTYRNNDGELLGRALLWHDGNETYIDRAYGSDVVIEMFYDYASEHGFTRIYDTGVRVTIHLDRARFDAYPYMDTLAYLSLTGDSGSVSTSSYNGDYRLKSTEGEPNLRGSQCADCGEWIDADSTYCEDCRENHTCYQCGYETGRYSSEYQDINGFTVCGSCLSDVTCKSCGTADVAMDGNYCDSCRENMTVCPRCDCLHEDNARQDYCRDCYDNHRQCDECGIALVKPLASASHETWEAWETSDVCADCETFRAHRVYLDNQIQAGQLPLFSDAILRAMPWGAFYGLTRSLARLSARGYSYENRRRQDDTLRYTRIAGNTAHIVRFNALTD